MDTPGVDHPTDQDRMTRGWLKTRVTAVRAEEIGVVSLVLIDNRLYGDV